MPPSISRRSTVVRSLVRGVVGVCAVICLVLPPVASVGRLAAPNGYRIDGRPGVSAVLKFGRTTSVRVIGFGPGTDGDYSFVWIPILLITVIPPVAWHFATRRSLGGARFDVWFRRACDASPCVWGVCILFLEPAVWLICVLAAIVAGAFLGLQLVGRAVANRKTLAERRYEQGLCPTCGYDVRATPARCPECGHRVALSPLKRG